jgi:hypothetical protein
MEATKLTKGRRVRYESKANEGRGEVMGTRMGRTGLWVTLFDKQRNTAVTVRPSQVFAK